MPSRRRPYRPKVKGCYECSQRRVSCDRQEPECGKCISRGLKCSGLDVRYRFNKGVASRGKWVGKTMESIFETAHEPAQADNLLQGSHDTSDNEIPQDKEIQEFERWKHSAENIQRAALFGLLAPRRGKSKARGSAAPKKGQITDRPRFQTPIVEAEERSLKVSMLEGDDVLSDNNHKTTLQVEQHAAATDDKEGLWNDAACLPSDTDILLDGADGYCTKTFRPLKHLSFSAMPDNVPSWRKKLLLHCGL
ncbi:unnamed protein product [Clonostachys rosea]|uniref:Zn(2)-C6 fungal-type domain-containing protein n=1 Tax=Bionectria ochroleuca TaxID=29856 RepID=A0ABY6UHG7_BIOOC|nr:unnamed protein product [Clonostachys rosea]